MKKLSDDLRRRNLLDLIRQIYLESADGLLEIHLGGGDPRRLFFRRGQLLLPPGAQLAEELGKVGTAEESDRLRALTRRMVPVMAGWTEGSVTFDPTPASVPPTAVGPLPTGELVAEAAVHDAGEAELLQRLGGDGARLMSVTPPDSRRLPELDDSEKRLVVRLEQSASLGRLLAEQASDTAKRDLLRSLSRLEAVGLLRRPGSGPGAGRGPVQKSTLERLGERIAADLDRRPVALDPTEHRQRVAALLAKLGELNHYQLLEVEPASSPETVHAAYTELARLVHPRHAERLGFGRRAGAIAVLFERATEAYLVLSDPVQRVAYNQEAGLSSVRQTTETVQKRRGDAEQAAAAYFRQAQEMMLHEEYHYAIELLRQAVASARRPEYFALMAEAQSKNPRWLDKAADSYREALQLDPDSVSIRSRLAQLYEQLDQPERAVGYYRSILLRRPDDEEARQSLARIERAIRRAGGRGGFLSGLFGRK